MAAVELPDAGPEGASLEHLLEQLDADPTSDASIVLYVDEGQAEVVVGARGMTPDTQQRLRRLVVEALSERGLTLAGLTINGGTQPQTPNLWRSHGPGSD
ncbi:MAG TPA: hypothetical protein VIO94_11360 [Phenylobacterium sp.]